jgi:heme oxygenase
VSIQSAPAGHLRQRLKDSTRDLHDRVEATNFMARLMRDDLTPREYARTMRGLHALYAALEPLIARVGGLREVLPDLDQRMKTASLAADLRALPPGSDPEVLATAPAVDPIATAAAALGTLYVLEGSTMGGRLIATKLKTREFVRPESLRFFEHYGAQANVFWRRFVRVLDEVPAADHDQVVAAARRTFEYFIALS